MSANKPDVSLVRDKIAQTLDALDYYGVAGATVVCLFPDGATHFSSMGTCLDPRGGALGLYAGLTAVRDLAQARGDEALYAMVAQAVHVLSPLIQPGEPQATH
jgi:hypothetical protein